MATAETTYKPRAGDETNTEGFSLPRLKRQYTDFISAKRAEMDEAKLSEQYYHAAQWTAAELKALEARKQPPIVYNLIGSKIDSIVGVIERLRQDPKAYPRTPQHEQGADLATAVLRYALSDLNDWTSLSSDVAREGAINGIGGLEISLEPGDKGDPDIKLDIVDSRNFFYDPRSVRPDFSDARYMGIGKWVDRDAAVMMFPDHADAIRDYVGTGTDGEVDIWDERDIQWTNSREKRVRLIEHWYKYGDEWRYCFYCGSLVLDEGVSFLRDEKSRTRCRFIMYSNGIDHDGDRYGFVRNLKGPQDEVNHRRSRGLHELNSRRIILDDGAVLDVEATRREAAKPDGVIVKSRDFELSFDDTSKQTTLAGNIQLMTEAKDQISQFGPNPALVGEASNQSSGRAIALLQQAGIAQLGPYILRYRGWKVRVYRAVWNAIQQYWVGERFIRVADDEEVQEFVAINQLENTPAGPQLVNALGNLDVDIIVDEGPDKINSMADTFDTMMALMQAVPAQTPQQASIREQLIIDLSSLPSADKKKYKQLLQEAGQPSPAQQQAEQINLAGNAAKVRETESKAALNFSRAQEAQIPQGQGEFQTPPEIQMAKDLAEVDEKQASADLRRAQAFKTETEARLAPQQISIESLHRHADRQSRSQPAFES